MPIKKAYQLNLGSERRICYGADYNPDQWQHAPEIIEEDFRLMREANCTSMSVGIFAWTSYQPDESTLTFDWLDRIMDKLAENGMTAVLATPSGSKPMWMSEKYPEIRRVNRDGIRQPSGGRHNHCPTSSVYREKVQEINRALAERYKNHPALALWHLGNELNGDCHCELCRRAFQNWLEESYGNLERLNRKWWSHFWNHTFTKWEQIPTHDGSIDGLVLDWSRFVNEQHVSFLLNEMEPLREITPQIPCTTNMMGTHPTTNYWQWSDHLDIISNDIYPMPSDRESGWKRSVTSDFIHSLMRGLNQGQPWIQMECSPSSVNWGSPNKLKRPGAHRQEMLQAVAHGADAIQYFQWRKGRGGAEKFHGAVVDHEGSNQSRVFQECAAVGEELKQLSPLVAGFANERAEVAIVFDWESRWAFNASHGPKKHSGTGLFEGPHGELIPAQATRHFDALSRCAVDVDCIRISDGLAGRKVVVTPTHYKLTEAEKEALVPFVENGGIWVATFLSAYVDDSNRCWQGGFPGPDLRDVFGIWNEELDNLYDDEQIEVSPSPENTFGFAASGQARDHIERVQLEGAEALAVFSSDFHAGLPAITHHAYGKGHCYYIAGDLDADLMRYFYQSLVTKHGLKHWLPPLPDGVTFKVRNGSDGKIGFLFNYTKKDVSVDLGRLQLEDVGTGATLTGLCELEPYASIIARVQPGLAG
jgi:beta-galactosidase